MLRPFPSILGLPVSVQHVVYCRRPDTAVIEDATTLLVIEQSMDSMALVCEALELQEARNDLRSTGSILWVLSPAWKAASG